MHNLRIGIFLAALMVASIAVPAVGTPAGDPTADDGTWLFVFDEDGVHTEFVAEAQDGGFYSEYCEDYGVVIRDCCGGFAPDVNDCSLTRVRRATSLNIALAIPQWETTGQELFLGHFRMTLSHEGDAKWTWDCNVWHASTFGSYMEPVPDCRFFGPGWAEIPIGGEITLSASVWDYQASWTSLNPPTPLGPIGEWRAALWY